jgi:hypothetical protein
MENKVQEKMRCDYLPEAVSAQPHHNLLLPAEDSLDLR